MLWNGLAIACYVGYVAMQAYYFKTTKCMLTHTKLYIIIMTSWQNKVQEISNLISTLPSNLSNFT
jgi:hypothetical protein